jgi:hypothetical protein
LQRAGGFFATSNGLSVEEFFWNKQQAVYTLQLTELANLTSVATKPPLTKVNILFGGTCDARRTGLPDGKVSDQKSQFG